MYVLIWCKKQICYSHILDYIHDNICSLDGTSFMADFEYAMRNAIARKYPNAYDVDAAKNVWSLFKRISLDARKDNFLSICVNGEIFVMRGTDSQTNFKNVKNMQN